MEKPDKIILFSDSNGRIYILQNFAELLDLNVCTHETGKRFRLYQDGDLWLFYETAEPGTDHDLFDE